MNRPGQESAGYQRTAVLATDVRGADIRCASDECGSIDDLIVDMRSGRVVFVSIDPDENFLPSRPVRPTHKAPRLRGETWG